MFANIMSGVQRRTADISQKIDENLGRLDHTVGQLTEDGVGLKTAVQQDREDRRWGGTEDSCAAGQRRQKMGWDCRQLCSRTEKTEDGVGLQTAVQ